MSLDKFLINQFLFPELLDEMNLHFKALATDKDLRTFSQRNCATTVSERGSTEYFGLLRMGLYPAISKIVLLKQTTYFAQAVNATYSASAELRLIMDSLLEVQSHGALNPVTKIFIY